jgi:hypothetical protein
VKVLLEFFEDFLLMLRTNYHLQSDALVMYTVKMGLQDIELVLLSGVEEEDLSLCQIVQSPKPSPIFAFLYY